MKLLAAVQIQSTAHRARIVPWWLGTFSMHSSGYPEQTPAGEWIQHWPDLTGTDWLFGRFTYIGSTEVPRFTSTEFIAVFGCK